jgi:hypothetical protein
MPQETQARPIVLHELCDCATQFPAAEQHPDGHEVASQTHTALTHRLPLAQAGTQPGAPPAVPPAVPPAAPPAVPPDDPPAAPPDDPPAVPPDDPPAVPPDDPPAVPPDDPPAVPPDDPPAVPPDVPPAAPPDDPPDDPPAVPPLTPPAAPPESPPPVPDVSSRHAPTWHTWFCGHCRHETPETPQKSTVLPLRHMPLGSQQPRHVSAHRRPGGSVEHPAPSSITLQMNSPRNDRMRAPVRLTPASDDACKELLTGPRKTSSFTECEPSAWRQRKTLRGLRSR